MSLLEKFNEHKKAMYAKFDKAHEACAKAMDEASEEFLDNFKSLVANASEDEFMEFVFNSGDELDEVDKIAAIAARLEAKRDNEKAEANDADEKPKRPDGPGVVIIGLG